MRLRDLLKKFFRKILIFAISWQFFHNNTSKTPQNAKIAKFLRSQKFFKIFKSRLLFMTGTFTINQTKDFRINFNIRYI